MFTLSRMRTGCPMGGGVSDTRLCYLRTPWMMARRLGLAGGRLLGTAVELSHVGYIARSVCFSD